MIDGFRRIANTYTQSIRIANADGQRNSAELSVTEKIWLLIVEVVNVIAEALNCDTMALTEQVISNDKQIKAVKMAFDKLATAA